MANSVPQYAEGKVFNRSVRISKGASLIVGDQFATVPVTATRIANADNIDSNIFVANRPFKVVGISEVHTTAGSDGGAVTLQVRKCTGTQAPASGVALLASTINLKGTAQTVQAGTLTSTAEDLVLAAGDRLALDYTGTITSLAGVQVTVDLLPV